MKLLKLDYIFFLIIFIFSLLFSSELFLHAGRPATFDANIHISTITQFGDVLKSGEFPVVWLNNFANYGLPTGMYTHQVSNYLGGFINIFLQDPVLTYNLLIFNSIFFSSLFLYLFLRLYFKPESSLLGTFILCFSQFRIFDVYVRGALPEVFSSMLLPLILISIYYFIVKRKNLSFFSLSILTTILSLTHPMMLVVNSLLFFLYIVYLLLEKSSPIKEKAKLFIASILSMLLGFLISMYYFLPLNLEIKYFYEGLTKNHLIDTTFLSFQNYFGINSDYFQRGGMVQFGLVGTIILIISLFYYIYKRLKKTNENLKMLEFVLVSSAIVIYFTTPLSKIFYDKLFFLNSLQFPYRFLSDLIFLPPIALSFLYERFPRKIIFLAIIIAVGFLSFTQIYGKNFTYYPNSSYYSEKENPNSIMMNTIWIGKTEDYPTRTTQGKIIEGKGQITSEIIKNSERQYVVNASTSVKMVDYTFYFPGWTVYIDGKKTNIEFQDPKYRGVITYNVPSGKHSILVKFEDTKIRQLGKIITLIFSGVFILLFIFRKRLFKLLP